jgi:hypothetical protein
MKIQLLAVAVLAALVAPCSPVLAQDKTKQDAEREQLINETNRKNARQLTLEAFKALKVAQAAKEKADCEGTPEEKKKANDEYSRAQKSFQVLVANEASFSEASMQARHEHLQAYLEKDAADKNPSIPEEYKKEAAKKLQKATEHWDEVNKNERARILRDFEAGLKEVEKCPPKGQTMVPGSGGYLGGELVKNTGRVRSTESLAETDLVTNRFTDSGDPLGVGIVAGYNFKPWNNSIVIGPFASFDYLNQTINHTFAGGQFLGTTTRWFINAGVKAGVVTAPGFFLYGLAGAAFLNHDLNVNFATAAQSNVTTSGFTLGVGGEYQPPSWQLAGHPVSLFAQYQHTWWDNANFNRPASSPAFNYAFRREDDTIKLGVNFYFGAAPASTSPAYPVKALPLK